MKSWPERIIAGATIVYTIFAILQWTALRKTVEESKELIGIANRQAKAAEEQVRNLEKTLVETRKVAEASAQSAEVARQALLLNVRPVVEIHGQHLDTHGLELRATIGIVNTGSMRAIIREQEFDFWLRARHEPYTTELPAVSGTRIRPLAEQLESQERVFTTLRIEASETSRTIPQDVSIDRWHAWMSNQWIACLSGRVCYEDAAGHVHVTSFCQAWNRELRKFIVLDEMPPLYNYRS